MENKTGMEKTKSLNKKPNLVQGMLYPLKGIDFFMRHPKLMPLAIIPIIINTVFFSVIFYFAYKYFNKWMTSLLPQGDAWYWVVLTYLVAVLVVAFLLLFMALTFTMCANLFASPFNDALSSKTEMIVTGKQDSPISLKAIIAEIGRTIVEELKKIGFYVVIAVALLFLNFIPVIGSLIYFVLYTLLTIFWLGMSFLDYTFARHEYKFGAKMKYCRSNLMPVMGFGSAIFVGALIPLFNLVFFPIAVVGGTLLFLDLNAVNAESSE